MTLPGIAVFYVAPSFAFIINSLGLDQGTHVYWTSVHCEAILIFKDRPIRNANMIAILAGEEITKESAHIGVSGFLVKAIERTCSK